MTSEVENIMLINEILDKIRLSISRSGIATIRTLKKTFTTSNNSSKADPNTLKNELFLSCLLKVNIHLSKNDCSLLIKNYKISQFEVNYTKFLQDVGLKLENQALILVQDLFSRLQINGLNQYSNSNSNPNAAKTAAEKSDSHQNETQTNSKTENKKNNYIFYSDLMEFFDASAHPFVKSARVTEPYIQTAIRAAFIDIVDNDDGHITWPTFELYFADIYSAFPFNTQAFFTFVYECWHQLFDQKSVKQHMNSCNSNNNSSGTNNNNDDYLIQIESVLVEKARQKVSGQANESKSLLRCFKHFDLEETRTADLRQFCQTLENFGVIVPARDAKLLFEKWSVEDGQQLDYQKFVTEIFKKY